jgi:hypothetical protein
MIRPYPVMDVGERASVRRKHDMITSSMAVIRADSFCMMCFGRMVAEIVTILALYRRMIRLLPRTNGLFMAG